VIASWRLRTKLLGAFLVLAVLTLVMGVMAILFVRDVSDQGQRVGAELAPLADAAMEINLSATSGHLLLEEVMSGETSESSDDVWALFDRSRWFANAILEGGTNDHGRFVPSEDPGVRALATEVRAQIDTFIEAAKERYAKARASISVGGDEEDAFDETYDGLQGVLAELLADARALGGGVGLAAVEAVGQARYHMANGHLLLMEQMAGDDAVSIDDVMADFKAASGHIDSLAATPLADRAPALAADIATVIDLAGEMHTLNQTTAAELERINERFDTAFDSFLAQSEEVEEAVAAQMDAALASAGSARTIAEWAVIAITVLVLLAAVGLAIWLGRNISGRTSSLSGAMLKLADRDLSVAVPHADDRDEIGDMAKAVRVFKDTMVEADRLAAEQARDTEKRQARAARIETLNSEFDKGIGEIVGAVAAAATELRSTAESMSSIAEETNSQATTVAAASEQASTNVQTVASAAEELSSSISEIGRQAQQSSDIARKAASEAQRSNEVVSGLADAAQKIGEVVNLITDIADQTNLLALNATIEAARAGDAGKGFAVVANEVKSLATQTAKATEDIGRQIGAVQSETQTAVSAIDSISKIIREINEVTAGIASAVEEQNAATQEIARNIQQASQGTSEVSSTIGGVTEAAREAGSAADNVLQATATLNEQSTTLKSIVERFLADVRAA